MTDSNFQELVQLQTPQSVRRVGLSRRVTTAPLLSIIKGRTPNPSFQTPKLQTLKTETSTSTSTTGSMPKFLPAAPPPKIRAPRGSTKRPKVVEPEPESEEDLLAPPEESPSPDSSSEDEKRNQSANMTTTDWGRKNDALKSVSIGKGKKGAAPAERTSSRPTRGKSTIPSSSAASAGSNKVDMFGDLIKKKSQNKYTKKVVSSQASRFKSSQEDEGSPEPNSFKAPEIVASTPKKRKRPGADPESESEPKLLIPDLDGLIDTPVTAKITKLRKLGDEIDDSDMEEEFKSSLVLGLDDLLDSPPPKPSPKDVVKQLKKTPKPKERDPNLEKYYPATQAAPDFNLDFMDSSLLLTQAQEILGQDHTPLKPPTTQDELDSPSFHFAQTQVPSKCPMCHAMVDPEELKAQGPMNVSAQERFCQSHQRKTAQDNWKEQGYPDIDWTTLPKRLEKYHKRVERWIKGEESHYRTLYGERVAAGQDRTLRKLTSNLIPGYYGSRGLQVISESIMSKHTRLLKKVAPRDVLISKRSVAAYMQAVLVPEITTLLIMEDMDVDEERAREILDESVGIGELLQEEVKDVHVRKRKGRVEDSEEDSDEFDELA